MEAMILAIGLACTVYTAAELLSLARAARSPAEPAARARVAASGRPLTLRRDRRRGGGRRAVDRRRA